MEWGYGSGSKDAHCFVEVDDPNLKRSLCGKVISFTVDPINLALDRRVFACFGCLVQFVLKTGVSK